MDMPIDREIGQLGKPRFLVLGLDPGIASCGFALLDYNNHEILEMGSRLFKTPEDYNKRSAAAVRRQQRSTRRNNLRTKQRLTSCFEALKDAGLIDGGEGVGKECLRPIKGDKPVLELRHDALERKLEDREWARVLYTLCKDRGYIDHGTASVDSGDESSDDKKMAASARASKKRFERSGARTVGDWIYSEKVEKQSCPQKQKNKKGSYSETVLHECLVEEVKELFKSQREHGSEHASQDFLEKYLAIFNFEKGTDRNDERVYEKQVGYCTYYKDEKRAAKCTLSSEKVEAYAALGNVRIVPSSRCKSGSSDLPREERKLTVEERDTCIEQLFSLDSAKDEVTYADVRKALDLQPESVFKGVRGEEESSCPVATSKAWRCLCKKLVGNDRSLLERVANDAKLADSIMEAIAFSSSKAVLRKRLDTLDLNDKQKGLLETMPCTSKMFNGYGARSVKALRELLKAFEGGELDLTDAEAVAKLNPWKNDGGTIKGERLAPYETWLKESGRVNTNPVVLRSAAQMRKVVNCICNKWGVPHEIHVEVERELKRPRYIRIKDEDRQKKEKKANESAAEEIAEKKGWSPSEVRPGQIFKYCLWKEQKEIDIYTGDAINFDDLFGERGAVQIDHILPWSRTGEDSKYNKVLVTAKSNQDKGDRSPYEWMHSGEPDAPKWDYFENRVRRIYNQKNNEYKRSLLLEDDLDNRSAGFQNKNLTDTAYVSRELSQYLEDCLLFPEEKSSHVITVSGQGTGWLRRVWGLNKAVNDKKDHEDSGNGSAESEGNKAVKDEKDRENPRHHAVDACVIAACNRDVLRKLTKENKSKYYGNNKKDESSSAEGEKEETQEEEKERRKREREKAREEREERLRGLMPWPTFVESVKDGCESLAVSAAVLKSNTGKVTDDTIFKFDGWREDGKALKGDKKKKQTKEVTDAEDEKGKPRVSGNCVVSYDGETFKRVGKAFEDDGFRDVPSKIKCLKNVGDMMYLQLWCDKSGKKVKWYPDPVYYWDQPAIARGEYKPKIARNGKGVTEWEPVPEDVVKTTKPLVIYPKQKLLIDGKRYWYRSFNISKANWELIDCETFEGDWKKITTWPTINSLSKEDSVKMLGESILGR